MASRNAGIARPSAGSRPARGRPATTGKDVSPANRDPEDGTALPETLQQGRLGPSAVVRHFRFDTVRDVASGYSWATVPAGPDGVRER